MIPTTILTSVPTPESSYGLVLPKIDIHCHTTNRKLEGIVPRSAGIDTILEEMERHEIEKTVLLASYFPHKSSGISNFRLLRWISDNKKFLMFGSLDFEHYFYQGYNELAELAEQKLIKGIKIYSSYQKIDVRSGQMQQIAQLASQYNLPLMFHGGESYTSLRKYNQLAITNIIMPQEIGVLAQEHGLDIIISHLCTPFLPELIKAVNRNNHLYSDLSGVFDSKYGREAIPECIEEIKQFLGECGPEKLLFGTDFPVQTHKDSVYLVEEAMKSYSSAEKQAVYYNNAVRLLK